MQRYEHILAAASAQPWAILPEKGRAIAAFLTEKVGKKAKKLKAADFAGPQAAAKPKKKSQQQRKGVAVIQVLGTMTQRADWMTDWSGGCSTEVLGSYLDEAMDDDSIEAIVFDIDSPGGSVYGVSELGDKIYNAGKMKKTIAVANSLAASAAYWIACQCKEFIVSPSSQVGSIGVYQMHVDESVANELAGMKVTLVNAGELKTAANQYAPLDDTGRSVMQKGVDDYYAQFVKAVARGRGVAQSTVRESFGKGSTVRAEEAVKLGMADKVGTLEEVLARYGLAMSDLQSASASELSPEIEIRKRKLKMALTNQE